MSEEHDVLLQALRETNEFRLAEAFLESYHAARIGLKELGILRSERTLLGDYAEWIVARLLSLDLAASGVPKGFYAMDGDGATYQIKARRVARFEQNTSFDVTDIDLEFDYLVGVLLSRKMKLLGLIRVPYEAFVALCRKNKSDHRLRWTPEVRADPRVEILFRRGENPRAWDGGA